MICAHARNLLQLAERSTVTTMLPTTTSTSPTEKQDFSLGMVCKCVEWGRAQLGHDERCKRAVTCAAFQSKTRWRGLYRYEQFHPRSRMGERKGEAALLQLSARCQQSYSGVGVYLFRGLLEHGTHKPSSSLTQRTRLQPALTFGTLLL